MWEKIFSIPTSKKDLSRIYKESLFTNKRTLHTQMDKRLEHTLVKRRYPSSLYI